jgi:hypothetical protein
MEKERGFEKIERELKEKEEIEEIRSFLQNVLELRELVYRKLIECGLLDLISELNSDITEIREIEVKKGKRCEKNLVYHILAFSTPSIDKKAVPLVEGNQILTENLPELLKAGYFPDFSENPFILQFVEKSKKIFDKVFRGSEELETVKKLIGELEEKLKDEKFKKILEKFEKKQA